jgi:hypothetical protein
MSHFFCHSVVFCFFAFILFFAKLDAKTELIIFSFNRPMQLYGLLESIKLHVKGLDEISILFRASDPKYRLGYRKISHHFPNLKWVCQGNNPKTDFKPLLNHIFDNSKADFILFAVDDMIVSDYIDLKICEKTLSENNEIYGFYLRLGENIHPMNSKLRKTIQNDIFTWMFDPLVDYWGYPHTLDMTLFRKDQIVDLVSGLNFTSPNTLEAAMAALFPVVPYGSCFQHSKVLNIPVNLVQQDWGTQYSNQFSAREMLNMFLKGNKIDISLFYKIDNKSPHEYKNINIIKMNAN